MERRKSDREMEGGKMREAECSDILESGRTELDVR